MEIEPQAQEAVSMETLCTFCEYAPRKYTCPRCNASYCSSSCYNSNGHLQCTEFFYESCVREQLAGSATDTDSVTEILGRLHSTATQQPPDDSSVDSDDDEECLSLSERLAGVDLNDSKRVWEQLTADERQEFEAFLKSEDVSKLVPEWKAWWEWRDGKVQAIEDASKYKQNCPEIRANIKDFDLITKKEPAVCVRYNLTNIISAYAFTARYFNGDHSEFVDEAVGYITALSLCLQCGENFNGLNEAIQSVLHECTNNDIGIDTENTRYLHEDVQMILRGPCKSEDKYYVLCALSEIHKLMSSVLSKGETVRNVPHLKSGDFSVKRLKLHVKKIEYYLSYVVRYYNHENYAPIVSV